MIMVNLSLFQTTDIFIHSDIYKVNTFSGGKTCKSIDNLAAANPHKFRVQIILKDVGIPQLLKRALQFYGGEKNIINTLLSDQLKEVKNYEHEVHDNGDERKNEIITRKLHNGLKEEVHFNDSINKYVCNNVYLLLG